MKRYRIKKGITVEQLALQASISNDVAALFIGKKSMLESSSPFYSKYVAWFLIKSASASGLNFKVGIPYSCLELVSTPKRKCSNHPLTKIFMPDKSTSKRSISKNLITETTIKE